MPGVGAGPPAIAGIGIEQPQQVLLGEKRPEARKKRAGSPRRARHTLPSGPSLPRPLERNAVVVHDIVAVEDGGPRRAQGTQAYSRCGVPADESGIAEQPHHTRLIASRPRRASSPSALSDIRTAGAVAQAPQQRGQRAWMGPAGDPATTCGSAAGERGVDPLAISAGACDRHPRPHANSVTRLKPWAPSTRDQA